jgi:signal peptidase I
MSSKNNEVRGKAANADGGKAAVQSNQNLGGAAGKRPLVATFVWLALCVVSQILFGCPEFSGSYLLGLVFILALVGAELGFLDAVYRKKKYSLIPGWKKFTGYSLVFCYAFQALPRVGWQNDGLIAGGRVVFLFVLSLACLVAGFVAFLQMGRPAVLADFGLITEEEIKDKALRKKNRAANRKTGFLHGLFEWVDAIAFAAIAVILINIFIFQLYVIPSESMVPTFLINDRPFTLKCTMGPRLPLTDWRLPFIDEPKSGDIVTIANPRYPENRQVNIKKQLSQFVFMLTFTKVNIDRQADGTPKNDPLVKRVVGVPGEQLMMIDDQLYARKAGEAGFKAVEEDRTWARVDLWKESAETRSKIQALPLDEKGRALLDAWDARKNGADLAGLGAGLAASARRIEALAFVARGRTQPVPSSDLAGARDEVLSGASLDGASYIASLGVGEGNVPLALALAAARNPAVATAVAVYARDGAAAAARPAATPYERGSRALDLLIKANFVGRVERALELLAAGKGPDEVSRDQAFLRLQSESSELRIYFFYYDYRNFPAFPSGDAVLGRDEYFAMGDNRYNSLDFRFQERMKVRALDQVDASSVRYRSQLAPFALEKKYIEGRASFILWPFSRFGKLGK